MDKSIYENIRDNVIDQYLNLIKTQSYINNNTTIAIPCVVFDLDDTLILQYNRKPIRPMIELYKFFISQNVPIFIITARALSYKKKTVRELQLYGVSKCNSNTFGYQDIYMKPDIIDLDDKKYWKRDMRKSIIDSGYKIIFNIGDDDTDFYDGYYDNKVKLLSIDF